MTWLFIATTDCACFVKHWYRITKGYYVLIAMIIYPFLESEVSYQAASCTALTHEVLRVLTDESKELIVQAAKFGLVFMMLFELQCLIANRKYTEVSVLCMH